MHRVEASNKVTVGGKNLFSDGPPGTTVEAAMMNALQEEIAYLIETNGLTLRTEAADVAPYSQIHSAVAAQITSSSIAQKEVDFSTDPDLVINVQSNTTVDLDCSNILMVNSSGTPTVVADVNETFDIAADLMAGTAEKASHWYQLWYDSLGAKMMVPDLESVADANVANSLSDSTATFVTDLVQVNDEIYQTTDLTKGYVKAISSENIITIKDAAGADLDLFPLGTEAYKIRLLSPTGLSATRARLGAAYNNAASNIDDSTYTQTQEEKNYSATAGDFALTGIPALTSAPISDVAVRQVNDWTGKGTWRIAINFVTTVANAARTTAQITIAGVAFAVSIAAVMSHDSTNGPTTSMVTGSPNLLNMYHESVASTGYSYSGDIPCLSKPTFHN